MVSGRQDMSATVIVTVNRGRVWVAIDSSFTLEAILEPTHVDTLIDMLTQAAREAQRYEREKVP